MDEGKLELSLLSGVSSFADQNNASYKIVRNSLTSGDIMLEIGVGALDLEGVKELLEMFEHVVHLRSDEIISERTMFVENNVSSRRLYIDFLNYMKTQGINLTNSFKNSWASNPLIYPV